jgi:mannose-1-phosphate guanylyltransferase
LREYEALGTGGGLYHFRDQILRNGTETVFVLHADVACDFPLLSMLESHKKTKALVTVLATTVNPQLTSNYGCIVVNPSTNEALHYVEKPSTFVSNLISCGVYCLNSGIFDEISSILKAR